MKNLCGGLLEKTARSCSLGAVAVLSALALFAGWAHAEELNCEVMSLEGTAYFVRGSEPKAALKEGDLLVLGDIVETGADTTVDLGFDKDWNNIARIEENSTVTIEAIYPIVLRLQEGAALAKLKSLPKDSTFEVQTPMAVAAVRGTEYRTTHQNGQSEVFNLSESPVYVFGRDESGNVGETPVLLESEQKTAVPRLGMAPAAAGAMSEHEAEICYRHKNAMENRIRETVDKGRVGRLPDMNHIEKVYRENREKFAQGSLVSLDAGDRAGKATREAMRRQEGMMKVMNAAQERHFARPDGAKKSGMQEPNHEGGNGMRQSQKGVQPSGQPGVRPDAEPGFHPATQPGFQPGAQPGAHPGMQQPGAHPGAQPGFQPGAQPGQAKKPEAPQQKREAQPKHHRDNR